MNEEDRVQFIIDRDGLTAAIVWANQTLELYIEQAIKSSPYKDSIKYFRQFLKERGQLLNDTTRNK